MSSGCWCPARPSPTRPEGDGPLERGSGFEPAGVVAALPQIATYLLGCHGDLVAEGEAIPTRQLQLRSGQGSGVLLEFPGGEDGDGPRIPNHVEEADGRVGNAVDGVGPQGLVAFGQRGSLPSGDGYGQASTDEGVSGLVGEGERVGKGDDLRGRVHGGDSHPFQLSICVGDDVPAAHLDGRDGRQGDRHVINGGVGTQRGVDGVDGGRLAGYMLDTAGGVEGDRGHGWTAQLRGVEHQRTCGVQSNLGVGEGGGHDGRYPAVESVVRLCVKPPPE